MTTDRVLPKFFTGRVSAGKNYRRKFRARYFCNTAILESDMPLDIAQKFNTDAQPGEVMSAWFFTGKDDPPAKLKFQISNATSTDGQILNLGVDAMRRMKVLVATHKGQISKRRSGSPGSARRAESSGSPPGPGPAQASQD